MKAVVLQDPRRYFERTASGATAGPDPKSSEAAGLDEMATTDVLAAIDPQLLQSGMDSAAAKQVRGCILCTHFTDV